jgi:hypothetical protein
MSRIPSLKPFLFVFALPDAFLLVHSAETHFFIHCGISQQIFCALLLSGPRKGQPSPLLQSAALQVEK